MMRPKAVIGAKTIAPRSSVYTRQTASISLPAFDTEQADLRFWLATTVETAIGLPYHRRRVRNPRVSLGDSPAKGSGLGSPGHVHSRGTCLGSSQPSNRDGLLRTQPSGHSPTWYPGLSRHTVPMLRMLPCSALPVKCWNARRITATSEHSTTPNRCALQLALLLGSDCKPSRSCCQVPFVLRPRVKPREVVTSSSTQRNEVEHTPDRPSTPYLS